MDRMKVAQELMLAARELVGIGKWESPKGARKTWRRKRNDGSYEYRESKPSEHPKRKTHEDIHGRMEQEAKRFLKDAKPGKGDREEMVDAVDFAVKTLKRHVGLRTFDKAGERAVKDLRSIGQEFDSPEVNEFADGLSKELRESKG
jgi:hypothetical protein